MKKYLLLLLSSFLFISCFVDNKPKIVHDAKESSEKDEFKENASLMNIADLPIEIDSVEYLLHPIGKYVVKDRKTGVVYKSSNYGGKSFSVSSFGSYNVSGNMSNILFQHKDSQQLTSLTDKELRIGSALFLREIFNNIKKQFLVYEVVDKDTNADGELDLKDIRTLYISNIDGSKFMKLTKPNRELLDWRVLETKNRLYIKTIEDVNKDGDFDNKDRLHFSYINLNEIPLKVINYHPLSVN